uniref:Cytochrome c oxidase subunit 3 n=1 Tax=Timema poppense TaxID=170557 RepID=A0A7R9DJ97_TIMPO|nr:unnamed protein product [Timema poppensis]
MKSKEHDFHLVDPSPWPIAISAAILILALGLVGALHKQIFGMFCLVLGISAVSGVLFYWWRDVIREAIYDKCHTTIVKHGLKFAMYLFILSEVVFFIVFFCSFFKAWLDPVFLFEAFSPAKKVEWPPEGILPPDPWSLPFMNILILLLSGTTITWANHSLLENDKKSTIKMLSITILLGVFFIIVQAIEYHEASFSLQETGEKLIYTSNFYMITGFHCAHCVYLERGKASLHLRTICALSLPPDPGISKTGWAIISLNEKNNIEFLGGGTISTDGKLGTGERLHIIFEQLKKVIFQYSPNEAAVEKIFVNKNPKSSLTLGYARGVVILALKITKLTMNEYDANYVKKSITGNGHADKDQIIFMVKQIVKNLSIKCHHAADALAVAICHAYTKGSCFVE